jgi:hypothetical protein
MSGLQPYEQPVSPAAIGAEPTGQPTPPPQSPDAVADAGGQFWRRPLAWLTAGSDRPIWQRPRVLVAGSIVALVLVGSLVLLLVGGSKDLRVSFSLYDFLGSSDCEGGSRGYSDIGPGTDVVVKGGDGQIIGTAQLGDGPSTPMSEAVDDPTFDGGCIWSTTVKGVPTGEDFYSVSVGDRGEQTYSEDDLDRADWGLSLELGGS